MAHAIAQNPGLSEPGQLLRRRNSGPWILRAITFATCVLVMNALIGERGLIERWRAERQADRLSAEVMVLKRENAALRERGQRLASDPRTIESLARAQLGLTRRGELLVVLKDLPTR